MSIILPVLFINFISILAQTIQYKESLNGISQKPYVWFGLNLRLVPVLPNVWQPFQL